MQAFRLERTGELPLTLGHEVAGVVAAGERHR